MAAFAEHVRSLGGHPHSPKQYKDEFLAAIEERREERLSAVREGRAPAEGLLVPGTMALLEALRARGLRVYLASGTAHEDIVRESALLGLTPMFDGIYGSSPAHFNKRQLLEWIVASGVEGGEIVVFGDGRVEIEEAKAVGAIAVGVASDEEGCLTVDAKKRGWLIEAGADYIVPNFLDEGIPRIVAGEL
jgi:phosphoglycolate phosphatase-like HAD superfamily hydrolase